MSRLPKLVAALALAAAFLLPPSAADARYWHHGWGWGFGPGFALGFGLGAFPYYGYGGYYGYGYPAYYGYAPYPYYGGYYDRDCRTVRVRWHGHWRRVVRCY